MPERPKSSPLFLLPPGGRGPFVIAIFAALVPCMLIIAFLVGMKMNVYTFFGIVIPDTAITAVLVSISMGWIFVMIGRFQRRPGLIPATVILLGVAMAAMLGIIYIASQTAVPATGF